MIKHKPATALPWRMRFAPAHARLKLPPFIEGPKAPGMPYALDVCNEDYTGYGDEPARQQNMLFIVQACNAYAPMVEFLQQVSRSDKHALGAAADALLQNLGEVK